MTRHTITSRCRWFTAPLGAAIVVGAVFVTPCLGQFGAPASSGVRERIAGQFLLAAGAPTPEPGDQIGAFFGDQLVGVYAFTSESIEGEFELLIFGDDPDTGEVDGPTRGAAIELRFFDASTNIERNDLRFENAQGEAFNYRYQGQEIPSEFEGLPFPIDLTPTVALNIRLGAAPSDPALGGDSAPGPTYDVDANGEIDERDAAIVLRLVSGATRGATLEQISRADVNGDGLVSTADAIEILRQRR